MTNIKKEFLDGVLYTGIAKYSSVFLGIFISGILARLLTPSDFGVVAIATIFINFFSTLTTVGISPAIVQNKTISQSDLRSINSFSFLLAIAITGIYIFIIPIILKYYEDNIILNNILYLLAINVFFSIASVVPNAMLLKERMFKFIAVRTFIVNITLGIVSIIGAFAGWGVYSLLISPICSSIILLFVNFLKKPIGFGLIKIDAISKILSFSLFQMLFNLVYLSYRNIDKLLLGHYFGLSGLGYYEKSYRLMMLPLENVSSIISPVLHPILSTLQDDKESIWNAYKNMLGIVSEFCFSVSVLLFFCSGAIINIVFGVQWVESIYLFEILTFSIAVQLLQAPLGGILQSINKVKVLFYGSIYELLLVVFGVVVGILFNSMIVSAWGVVIAFVLGFFVYQLYIAKCFNKQLIEIIALLVPYFVYSLGLFVICFLIKCFMLNVYLQSIVCIIIFCIYEGISLYFGKLPHTQILLKTLINKLR